MITSNSESESADEDVNQISDDEVSTAAKEQPSIDEESNEEQGQQKETQVKPLAM